MVESNISCASKDKVIRVYCQNPLLQYITKIAKIFNKVSNRQKRVIWVYELQLSTHTKKKKKKKKTLIFLPQLCYIYHASTCSGLEITVRWSFFHFLDWENGKFFPREQTTAKVNDHCFKPLFPFPLTKHIYRPINCV